MAETFETDFLEQAQKLPPAAYLDSLKDLRSRARKRFAEQGFPDRKQEAWRFTDMRELVQTRFSPADAGQTMDAVSPWWWESLDGAFALMMGNGLFWPQTAGRDLPDGVQVQFVQGGDPLPDELAARLGTIADLEHSPFTALNTALFEDALFLTVKAETVVENPLQIHHLGRAAGAPTHVQPRIFISVESGASVRLVESYVSVGTTPYFLNSVVEIAVAANAHVDHVRVQDDDLAGYHVNGLYLRQERDSSVTSHSLNIGAGLSRHDIVADLVGENAECTLNGLYLGEGSQLHDTHSVINHRVPNCRSHQLYKGVLDNQARGVFCGLIHVYPQAQKTDAFQTNRALLLSDEAKVNTKPQLLIFADDVKCSHGTTIGQLDEDALFYLETRGIDRQRARGILTVAFAAEAIEQMPFPKLRQAVDRMLLQRFSGDPS